jgi:hypothetical protein
MNRYTGCIYARRRYEKGTGEYKLWKIYSRSASTDQIKARSAYQRANDCQVRGTKTVKHLKVAVVNRVRFPTVKKTVNYYCEGGEANWLKEVRKIRFLRSQAHPFTFGGNWTVGVHSSFPLVLTNVEEEKKTTVNNLRSQPLIRCWPESLPRLPRSRFLFFYLFIKCKNASLVSTQRVWVAKRNTDCQFWTTKHDRLENTRKNNSKYISQISITKNGTRLNCTFVNVKRGHRDPKKLIAMTSLNNDER